MALLVWFPLNGNIENKGLSNVSSYSGSAPVYSAGKIGQCLEGSSGEIAFHFDDTNLIKNICLNKKYTIMTWLKNNAASSGVSRWVFRIGNGTGTSRGLWENNSGTTRHWAFSGTGVNCSTSIDCTQGWHHTCFVVDGTIVTLYVDGVKQGTATDSTTLPTENTITFNSYRDSLNDFRLYDEVLSDKQIKEIAKGLCAHYKLEGVGANPNLLYPSRLTESPTSFNARNWSVGTINNVNSSSFTSEGFSVTTPGNQTGNPNNGRMIDLANANTLIPAGTKVTFSIDIKGAATTARIRGFYQGTGTAFYSNFVPINEDTTATDAEWHRYYGTFTMPNVGTIDTKLHIALSQGWDEVTTRVYRNARLSLADGTTYWIPNINETDYNKLGFNNVCSRDVSGFSYNGTQYGSLVFNSDSPRYAGSTDFNNYGYLHYLSSPLNSSTDAFTFTCWFYPTQASNMALYNDRTVVGSGFSVFYLGGALRFDTGSNSEFQFSNDTSILNKWSFIACTYDKKNGIKKAYINGVQVGSTTSIGDLTQIGTNASIGNSSTNGAAGAGNQIYGSLSDVRIYCTALSAEDILKLYEISGIIDNKGNTYSYEFIEED